MDLYTESEIWLVTAICIHRIVICDSSEVCREIYVENLLEYMIEKIFHQEKDIVSFHITHLYIELCKLKLSISSRVLIAIASCNLEILIKA